jgi:CRP-like cAMP-binding protein
MAEKFYVILQGNVEVWKNYGLPSQDILAIRGAGDTFGEMALIDELPRSATLKTVEPTLCLVQKKRISKSS